eukprot:m.435159 g.435159  ORF g.435159 m.435159 type:complete len:439 (+) comp56761_c1_seq7:1009-2325(+)
MGDDHSAWRATDTRADSSAGDYRSSGARSDYRSDDRRETRRDDRGEDRTRAWIGGLAGVSLQAFTDFLRKFGTPINVDLKENFGFASYENVTDVDRLVSEGNRQSIGSNVLIVKYANQPKPADPGSSNCFNCGRRGHWAKECTEPRARDSSRSHRDDAPSSSSSSAPRSNLRDEYRQEDRRPYERDYPRQERDSYSSRDAPPPSHGGYSRDAGSYREPPSHREPSGYRDEPAAGHRDARPSRDYNDDYRRGDAYPRDDRAPVRDPYADRYVAPAPSGGGRGGAYRPPSPGYRPSGPPASSQSYQDDDRYRRNEPSYTDKRSAYRNDYPDSHQRPADPYREHDGGYSNDSRSGGYDSRQARSAAPSYSAPGSSSRGVPSGYEPTPRDAGRYSDSRPSSSQAGAPPSSGSRSDSYRPAADSGSRSDSYRPAADSDSKYRR